MDIDALIVQLTAMWPQVENALVGLVQPWRLYQIAILAALFAVAHLIAGRARTAMRTAIRNMDASKARLRVHLVIEHRLRPLIFVALSWGTFAAMQAITWPSRSNPIGLAASLAPAWGFVAITTRLIGNRLRRAVVRWGAGAFVTLHLPGLLPEATALRDETAISVGEVRLSALVILKPAVTLGPMLLAAGWVVRLAVGRVEAVEDLSPSMKVLADKLIRISVCAFAALMGLLADGFDLTNFAVLSGAALGD